jgi:hypothetical protein
MSSWAWDILASLRMVHGCLVMYLDICGINMPIFGAFIMPP